MATKFFEAQHAIAAREILQKHFHQKITAVDLADEIGVGEKTLKRAFKKCYGINLFGYQVQLRMERAKELLMQGDKSVKQVAKLVGYSGQSSFTRKFIRYFGSAPSVWIGVGVRRS